MTFHPSIEIAPIHQLSCPLKLTIPGSKSITNRALILAAHASGTVTLNGALWSEDTQIMTDALRALGYAIQVEQDPDEICNRTITVTGQNGVVPDGGSLDQPKEIFVANAGTAARFLVAMLCLGRGCYRISGVDRMHARPQKALFESLRSLGYRIDSPNDFLPAIIHGGGPRSGAVGVSVADSSQFASALLLSSVPGRWDVQLTDGHPDNLPYVTMTREMIESFPFQGGDYPIEPDASSASYFWAAAHLLDCPLKIHQWPDSHWQVDTRFPSYLPLPQTISRETDLGDSILTAMALAPFAPEPITFTDLGRLRVQECERVMAMRTELSRLGASVKEIGDTIIVSPSPHSLHGGTVQTYHDHRIAMSLSLIGLKIPGVIIDDPACIRKTFPNFYLKWADAPPQGLGGILLNPVTHHSLPVTSLVVPAGG